MLNISEGSVEERRYYLILARDLGCGRDEDLIALTDEVGRLLTAYGRSILALSS